MNFQYHIIHYVINIVPLCGEKMIELAKEKKKNLAKDKWELPSVIPLIPIVGFNHRLPTLHMSKMTVHVYTTDKTVHQFSIGYMINPSLHISFSKTKLKNSWVFLFLSKKCSIFKNF